MGPPRISRALAASSLTRGKAWRCVVVRGPGRRDHRRADVPQEHLREKPKVCLVCGAKPNSVSSDPVRPGTQSVVSARRPGTRRAAAGRSFLLYERCKGFSCRKMKKRKEEQEKEDSPQRAQRSQRRKERKKCRCPIDVSPGAGQTGTLHPPQVLSVLLMIDSSLLLCALRGLLR